MKEIKFRVWDEDRQTMLAITTLQEWLEWANSCVPPISKNIKFLQDTGMEDKNGKEIYEGDICNDGSVVHFMGGRFILNYKNKTHWEDLMGSEDEIIGNIYENPELLK